MSDTEILLTMFGNMGAGLGLWLAGFIAIYWFILLAFWTLGHILDRIFW
jgi:hypothetical protein